MSEDDALDLRPLLDRAFLFADAIQANAALSEARALFAAGAGGRSFSYEVLAPSSPTRAWLRDQLAPRLVYYCESSRAPLPSCAGVFVSLFWKDRLYCLPAHEVITFLSRALGLSSEALVACYGTGERKTALRD